MDYYGNKRKRMHTRLHLIKLLKPLVKEVKKKEPYLLNLAKLDILRPNA